MDETTAVLRVLAGYEGSLSAAAAIEVGGMLLPSAEAWIVHLWTPPLTDEVLRRHLRAGVDGPEELVAALEREGAAEAERIAATGVTLARAAGWEPEPVVARVYGGEGFAIAELAQKFEPDVVVVGSRGLGGVRALLDSVSDMVAHYTPRPVLVVPHPLLTGERADLADGPILVGWDGSAGSHLALAAAERLFPGRARIVVAVTDEPARPPSSADEFRTVPAAEGHVAPGRAVAEALAETARQRHAAVVVVGSRGRSAAREILVGSVAMATLHHVRRPVLVVHDIPHHAPEQP